MIYTVGSVHRPLLEEPLRWAAGEVLQVHRRSVTARVHLAVPGPDEVVTFALPELGDGPLGLLVSGDWPPPDLAPGSAVVPTPAGWQVGGHGLVLAGSAAWEPAGPPPGAGVEAWAAAMDVLAASLAAQVRPQVGGAVLALGLVPAPPDADAVGTFAARVHQVLAAAAHALREALVHGDTAGAAAAARRLLGVGNGLTPAGDDLLTGLLTFLLRAGHPLAAALTPVAQAAGGATTPVAAHMLRWAARGVVNAHLLALADAAVAGDPERLRAALPAALAHGASSGADFAAGVWLGLSILA